MGRAGDIIFSRRARSFSKMDKRDKSPERKAPAKVYTVVSMTIHSWNSVERGALKVFSSHEKAKAYCKRESSSWRGVTKSGDVRTGETLSVNGAIARRCVEIVPTDVDAPTELWRASHSDSTGRVVHRGPFNSAPSAQRYIESKIYYNGFRDFWRCTIDGTWCNPDTKEQWAMEKIAANLQ
jgi:hypothetical protein